MPIEVGDKLPAVTFKTLTDDGIQDVKTSEVFAGRKVVLFAVPGAFTPTCSDAHLPGFVLRADEMLEKGADLIACVAVNDPFVLDAWARSRNVGDRILMLSDGNGELTRALDLELDASRFGMGKRCRRFAAIVDDGRVETLNVEPGGEVGVSSAEAVLEAL